MTDLARFLEYARSFEVALATDRFEGIAPFFAADARHTVEGIDPLGLSDRGRDAVVHGLRRSVETLDRRFDTRIPEVLDGPELREDGIWMRFGLTLRREGVPELRLEGEHLTAYDDAGLITRIDEKMLGGCDVRAHELLERHDASLRPAASGPCAPRPQDLPELRDALQRTLVRAYGRAKSVQDPEAALVVCHPGFRIDTLPFGIETRDREDTRAQLGHFFSVFPDYRAETEGIASDAAGAAWWGRISMTFAGDLMGHRATGRRAELAGFSVFEFRDGSIARERFVFDLPTLCAGIGLPVAELLATLRRLRPA